MQTIVFRVNGHKCALKHIHGGNLRPKLLNAEAMAYDIDKMLKAQIKR